MKEEFGFEFKIDQMLHGYDAGHRLLSYSRAIDGPERHTALQLSDRSVDIKDIPKHGYLTGYPLPQEHAYVFSRTWAANEMPRPGCVWTHSLVISFTDLAQLDSLNDLMTLFNRPIVGEGYARYSKPLEFENQKRPQNSMLDLALARKLLTRLYLDPYTPVMLPCSNFKSIEETTLAIWSQQWPRLRRNFRFCTLTSQDRSSGEVVFDVQFFSHELPNLNLHTDDYALEEFEHDNSFEWLETCLSDLTSRSSNLRSFLKRAGGDISGGRERFAELCALFSNSEFDISSIERSLDYATNRLADGEGKLLRETAISKAIEHANDLNDDSLMNVLPYLSDSTGDMDRETLERLAKRYWHIDPPILLARETPKEFRFFLPSILKDMSNDSLLDAIALDPLLQTPVFKSRPELLTNHDVWTGDSKLELTPRQLKQVPEQLRPWVVKSIIAADRDDLAKQIVQIYGETLVSKAAVDCFSQHPKICEVFVSTCLLQSSTPTQLIEVLLVNRNSSIPRKLVYLLTKFASPHQKFSVNKKTGDVWASAWRQAFGELPSQKIDSVLVFLFARAEMMGGVLGASIYSAIFDDLCARITSNKFSYAQKSKLSHLLVPSGWLDWSYQSRFFRTVARDVVKYRYAKKTLVGITSKKRNWQNLLNAIRDTAGGRSYLRKTI